MLSNIILRSTAAFGGAPFRLKKCTALSSAGSGAGIGAAAGGEFSAPNRDGFREHFRKLGFKDFLARIVNGALECANINFRHILKPQLSAVWGAWVRLCQPTHTERQSVGVCFAGWL